MIQISVVILFLVLLFSFIIIIDIFFFSFFYLNFSYLLQHWAASAVAVSINSSCLKIIKNIHYRSLSHSLTHSFTHTHAQYTSHNCKSKYTKENFHVFSGFLSSVFFFISLLLHSLQYRHKQLFFFLFFFFSSIQFNFHYLQQKQQQQQ